MSSPKGQISENLSRVAVVSKSGNSKAESVANALIETLVSSGFMVLAVDPVSRTSARSIASLKDLRTGEIQFVISVGGDGTLLNAFRELGDETPVLGINVGGRGILTTIGPDNISQVVSDLRNGNYVLDRRIRISSSNALSIYPPALNEVYLIRVPLDSTPTYTVQINGYTVLTQKMDGIIISTPTGSTGHSLSLGGPVILETSSNFLLTPIGPVSKIPPVLCETDSITITSNKSANVVIDGQESYVAHADTSLEVSRHDLDAIFIRFDVKPLRQLNSLGFS